MHSNHISEITAVVTKALKLTPKQAAKAEAAIKGIWDDRSIAIVWTVEDVQTALAKAGYRPASKVGAFHVLTKVLRDHDAVSGVSHETLVRAAVELGYADRKRGTVAPFAAARK